MDNLEEVCENEPNAYDYVQACYVANDIPLELLEDIWPTVEFLVNAVVAYTQPADASNDDQFEYDQFEQGVSDEEEEEDEKSVAASNESDAEDQIEDPSEGLDIDRILAEEIKRLNVSRQTRRKSRRKQNAERNSHLLAGLIQESNAVVPSTSFVSDNSFELDPTVYDSMFSHCFSTLARISDAIPESNDDLDDYRLANSMYVNTKILEHNKELAWKVDCLGKCLKRALNELCLFRIALQNTVGDLRNEIELLRKNTLATIRRIIQGDIARREKMQEQWEEVQTFIRRKNRRITELTEQLQGSDLEVGFLLASHKQKIESACIAERNFYRVSERLEDMELELKKKRCTHCETNPETSALDKIEEEEIMKRREEKRKQIEDNEKEQIACAERYGKAIQNHIASTIQDLKNSTLPWHGNSDKQQNGQPIPVLHQRVAQAPNGAQDQKPSDVYRPGFVPYEVYHITRLRAEELEKETHKQERMNEILSRDMTKMKSENSELKEENKKLVAEMNKLKSMQQFYRKNGRQNTAEGIETPPDSNASDKSKDESRIDSLAIPKPPSPPELLEKSPHKNIRNSPIIVEPVTANANKRKLVDNNKVVHPARAFQNPIKAEFGNHTSKPANVMKKDGMRRPVDQPMLSAERRYFSPPQRPRRSVSPEAKRPAFAPPSLMPPVPLFQQPRRPPRENSFYDDSLATQASFRSFSPDYHRRDASPPSPQFEPMQRAHESWNTRPHRLPPANWGVPRGPPIGQPRIGPPPLMNARPVFGNELRPSFRPPNISPTPPCEPRPMQQRSLPPWHNGPMMRPVRPTTSWINNGSSYRR